MGATLDAHRVAIAADFDRTPAQLVEDFEPGDR